MKEIRMKLGADSRLASSQWETSLQSNGVSHWLGANLESALKNILYIAMHTVRLKQNVEILHTYWKCIFLKRNYYIEYYSNMSNKPALVQVMACHADKIILYRLGRPT